MTSTVPAAPRAVPALRRPTSARALVLLLSLALVAMPRPAAAGEQTIRCDSHGLRYNRCDVDTDGRVELVRKHGFFSCSEGRSWGYDPRGVWVDKGCSADFRVGRSGSHDRAVLGAVVGLAALAAIASSRHKQEAEEVAPWAVGSFSGRDDSERTEVSLTILPGGSVSGRAGSHEFSGTLKGDRLAAGRQLFRIAAKGNGFTATDERDASHRVEFRRVGSGY